jgi:hypothetical protein
MTIAITDGAAWFFADGGMTRVLIVARSHRPSL